MLAALSIRTIVELRMPRCCSTSGLVAGQTERKRPLPLLPSLSGHTRTAFRKTPIPDHTQNRSMLNSYHHSDMTIHSRRCSLIYLPCARRGTIQDEVLGIRAKVIRIQ